MKPNYQKEQNQAFTVVEIVVVTLITSIVLITMQALFSHSVKSTLKGEDNLDSIRAASKLFSVLNNDLSQLTSLSTDSSIYTIPFSQNEIPTSTTFGSVLQISNNTATITYQLINGTKGKYIERKEKKGGHIHTGKYGVPRMQKFEVLLINLENKISGATVNSAQVLINIVVKSNKKNIKAGEIKLSSLFFPERLSISNWNYIYF